MNKNIITLTTDFGTASHYTAALKGSILSLSPDINIVDISHNISLYNFKEAAFAIKNSYSAFPEGTVHIIGINTELSIQTPPVVILQDGHYFICTDNGLFSLIFDNVPERIYEIINWEALTNRTFIAKDLFVPVAVMIAEGNDFSKLVVERDCLKNKFIALKPTIRNDELKGTVIYVDNYENFIVNITEEQFKDFVGNNKFEISTISRHSRIHKISRTYSDVQCEGKLLTLFGTHGYLEIAMYKSTAASLLGISVDSTIIVRKL